MKLRTGYLLGATLMLASAGPALAQELPTPPAAVSDARSTLAAGQADAGTAALNIERTANRPPPPGFFDSANPAGLPVEYDDKGNVVIKPVPAGEKRVFADLLEYPFGSTDLAFRGSLAFVGGYHGVVIYDIANPDQPRMVTAIACPSGQGDVSVYGDLLFLSAEQQRGRLDCGAGGVTPDKETERFRGVRVFDISNMTDIRQVAAVRTCTGSHTNTIVPDPRDPKALYVYSSGLFPRVGTKDNPSCVTDPKAPDTSAFRIDVIRVPLDQPEKAAIVSRPNLFADPVTGALPATTVAKGGQKLAPFDATRAQFCHDFNIFPERGIGAAACLGNGFLVDTSDPANPKRMDVAQDANMALWHSGIFSTDGNKVMFTDEWGGGASPRCRAEDPMMWGADVFMTVADRKLVPQSYYKLPAAMGATSNCVAHNGGPIPVPGRDIIAQAWYAGGVSVVDFTDIKQPREVAYFARGPLDDKQVRLGGYWSVYWRAGRLFATDITRGLDVLQLKPSEHLTANEIAAASLVPGDDNPQTQYRPAWPNCPVVARAYLDQLDRSQALRGDMRKKIERALARPGDRSTMALASTLEAQAATATGRDGERLRGIATILQAPATAERCGG